MVTPVAVNAEQVLQEFCVKGRDACDLGPLKDWLNVRYDQTQFPALQAIATQFRVLKPLGHKARRTSGRSYDEVAKSSNYLHLHCYHGKISTPRRRPGDTSTGKACTCERSIDGCRSQGTQTEGAAPVQAPQNGVTRCYGSQSYVACRGCPTAGNVVNFEKDPVPANGGVNLFD